MVMVMSVVVGVMVILILTIVMLTKMVKIFDHDNRSTD